MATGDRIGKTFTIGMHPIRAPVILRPVTVGHFASDQPAQVVLTGYLAYSAYIIDIMHSYGGAPRVVSLEGLIQIQGFEGITSGANGD